VNFWSFGDPMIGTPVKLVRFETKSEKKTTAKNAYIAVLKTDNNDLINVYTKLYKNYNINDEI